MPQHADGIIHADVLDGEQILDEVIDDCRRTLEGLWHVALDLEARSWAHGAGLMK